MGSTSVIKAAKTFMAQDESTLKLTTIFAF